MLLLDAGALYAQADQNDPHHGAVVELLQAEPGALVTSQIATAEADYLILTRLGVEVELAFLEDLAAGTFVAECLNRDDLAAVQDIGRRYRDLRLGLADASLVVLARRFQTRTIMTTWRRRCRSRYRLRCGRRGHSPRGSSSSFRGRRRRRSS